MTEADANRKTVHDENEARRWAVEHMRFTARSHGKKGITWTAQLKRGPFVFERSAFGEVRHGVKLQAQAAAETVEDFIEHLRHNRDDLRTDD